MDYQNIFHLQLKGFDFKEAQLLDARGISHEDSEALSQYEDEREAQAEHLNDLEARGFYHGTDDPFLIERIERSEALDDRFEMFHNEY